MRGGQGSHQTCMSSERIETEQSLFRNILDNILYLQDTLALVTYVVTMKKENIRMTSVTLFIFSTPDSVRTLLINYIIKYN